MAQTSTTRYTIYVVAARSFGGEDQGRKIERENPADLMTKFLNVGEVRDRLTGMGLELTVKD